MAKNMQTKDLVLALHEEGLSYKEISNRAGVSNEYARTICSRERRKRKHSDKTIEGICRFCGKKLTYTLGAKKKEFCNDKCRSDYHNERNAHKPYLRVCEYCGRDFVSYGYPKKRFCNRECQTLSMQGKRSA